MGLGAILVCTPLSLLVRKRPESTLSTVADVEEAWPPYTLLGAAIVYILSFSFNPQRYCFMNNACPICPLPFEILHT